MLFNEYPYNGDVEFKLNDDIHSNKRLKKIGDNELDDLISFVIRNNMFNICINISFR